MCNKILGLRIKLDDRDIYTPGWKFADWEMRGVPVRIEIGPKDIAKEQVVVVNRLDRSKQFVPISQLAKMLPDLLENIQSELFLRAKKTMEDNTRNSQDFDELTAIIQEHRGLVKTGWCGQETCEMKVKDSVSATIRVITGEATTDFPNCSICKQKAQHVVYFAKSY